MRNSLEPLLNVYQIIFLLLVFVLSGGQLCMLLLIARLLGTFSCQVNFLVDDMIP